MEKYYISEKSISKLYETYSNLELFNELDLVHYNFNFIVVRQHECHLSNLLDIMENCLMKEILARFRALSLSSVTE